MSFDLISGPALRKRLNKSRWAIVRLMERDPSFPRPIDFAPNSKAWIVEEIDAWLKAKRAKRDAEQAAHEAADHTEASDDEPVDHRPAAHDRNESKITAD